MSVETHHQTQTLKIYLFYRLVLGAILYAMHETKVASSVFGNHWPELFRWSSLVYVGVALIPILTTKTEKLVGSTHKISVILAADVLLVLAMIHASGGVDSGLGYLLLICAAVGSMFLNGQLSIAFAAAICLFLIGESIYSSDQYTELSKSLFASGTLGTLVFITAITFKYLANRIRITTLKAEEQSAYARQLVQLAQHIVTRMRTGVIVISEENNIDLINSSALQLLELPQNKQYVGQTLEQVTDLSDKVNEWRKKPVVGVSQFRTTSAGHHVRINFAILDTEKGASEAGKIILYIEDYRALIQQAQQLKLASLGRLTASIAHEIRNPLGAISHASQLLAESPDILKEDQRFTEIILQHTKRVNVIIENTLSLSKRKEPKAESIDLSGWIPNFIREYSANKECCLGYHQYSKHSDIKMDPTHLRQVLVNLSDNGLRFCPTTKEPPKLSLFSGMLEQDETTFIDVVDEGPGIAEDQINRIFEPFYTTGDEGSGLGLYISKELCEINQASLSFRRTDDGKSCFRINFPHHQRMI